MKENRPFPFPALALLLATFAAGAEVLAKEPTWDFAANVDLQTRYFSQDPRWRGQESQSVRFSAAATAEIRWRNGDGDQRASFIPYLRWDQVDHERSLADLREAYWAFEGDTFELLIGANTVFWGVTESAHLVDIINQTDGVADIDGEDKLGQPMVNVAVQQDWGLLSLYLMPHFRERTYAGVDGRLRAPLPVDNDHSRYESSAKDSHTDLALRYSHYLGDFDIGLSLFSGTSREPRLLPDPDAAELTPHYDQIDQFGIDLQYTRDAWLWKLEALVRDGSDDTFTAAVGGFEYTFYQVNNSAADVGVLLEYQYDGRGESEPVTVADNDLFLGTRLALNDTQDTAVLAGMVYDRHTGETFFNIEADRRIGEHYVLELKARFLAGAGPEDVTYVFSDDDYVQLQLSRYF